MKPNTLRSFMHAHAPKIEQDAFLHAVLQKLDAAPAPPQRQRWRAAAAYLPLLAASAATALALLFWRQNLLFTSDGAGIFFGIPVLQLAVLAAFAAMLTAAALVPAFSSQIVPAENNVSIKRIRL